MGAAILLARYGCQVSLCEAGNQLGPLLRGFKRQGYHFDTGLHCVGTLGQGEALWRYLKMLGVLSHLELLPMRQDCVELFRFADKDVCLPVGLAGTADKLSELWPEHAAGIKYFIDHLRQGFLYSPLTNPDNMSSDFAVLGKSESAASLLDELAFPEQLKSLLVAHSIFMGTAPRDLALGDFALVSYSMSEGMHTIKGGGAALVDAFEGELEALGVEILTRSTVEKINLRDGAAASVSCADGRLIECDAVVYTGHPRLLPKMLPQGALRPSMSSHLLELEDTGECISIYGSSASDFAKGRFIYLCGSNDATDAFEASLNERAWITCSSGNVGPNGRRPIMANMSLPGGLRGILQDKSFVTDDVKQRPVAYKEVKNRYAIWMAERLRKLCPEMADFELIASSTDYSMRQWVYGSTGSVYGALHSLSQMPVLPRTKVPNLVLAGQGVILPGLLGALVSAAVAAGMLTSFDKVFKDFRNV